MNTPGSPKPGSDEPVRTMMRLIGAFAAPVVIYLLLWELVAGALLPNAAPAGREFAINLANVLIPCAGVLASIFLAGVKIGRYLGGGVMVLFFLYAYLVSGVAFSWLPIALTLLGVGLAWGLARFCPRLSPELDGLIG
ncbi:hypothetical protein [Salinicola halophilus]|uniref:hypothetical protein n=1 Tax=Salinicola halophilus TaxID=184065 RepID=UPI000DA13D11|nr:hypothetical protein [Salinicola halophilus]